MGGTAVDGMWGSQPFGRILGVPRKRTRHVLLDVLTPSGTMEMHILTRKGTARRDYRYLRKAKEGVTIPMGMLNQKGHALSGSEPEPQQQRTDGSRGQAWRADALEEYDDEFEEYYLEEPGDGGAASRAREAI